MAGLIRCVPYKEIMRKCLQEIIYYEEMSTEANTRFAYYEVTVGNFDGVFLRPINCLLHFAATQRNNSLNTLCVHVCKWMVLYSKQSLSTLKIAFIQSRFQCFGLNT